MKFQRAAVSIIRSIRQISLAKEWIRQCGQQSLPKLSAFVVNERAGDAIGLSVQQVITENGQHRFRCETAGRTVEEANDGAMATFFLDHCLDPKIAIAARPIWEACIEHKLPTYSIIPARDVEDRPVDVEQLYLPYSSDGETADVMISLLQATSTEGRFAMRGLLRPGEARAPYHFAVIIDPTLAAPAPATVANAEEAAVELEI